MGSVRLTSTHFLDRGSPTLLRFDSFVSHLVTRFESRYRSIVTRAAQGLVILRRRAIRNVKCITESTLAIVTNVLPVQSIS